MPEKKSDDKDVLALCSKMNISTRPSSVVRLGKDEREGPRPIKVSFPTPFDARIFLSKAEELRNDENESVKRIRCRPCRSTEEQVRYLKQKEENRKLNENAKANGVHERESFSLRNNGQIWKYVKHDDGKWKRQTDWKQAPSSNEATATGRDESVN